MRPLKRKGTNKHKSAKHFRSQTRYSKAPNIVGPMRGGIRF